MLNIIVELSKYLLLILVALYTLESFTLYFKKTASSYSVLEFYCFCGDFPEHRGSKEYLYVWSPDYLYHSCAGAVPAVL